MTITRIIDVFTRHKVAANLLALNTMLDRLAAEVRQRSADVPAGIVARDQGEMQLRALDQRRDIHQFEQPDVRSPALNQGDQLLVSQLPTVMTGLPVKPTLAERNPPSTLAGQWSSR